MATGRMHHQSRRLADNQQVLILKENREVYLLRGKRLILEDGELNTHRVPLSKTVSSLNGLFINPHVGGGNEFVQR
jgi:hypothetical protein